MSMIECIFEIRIDLDRKNRDSFSNEDKPIFDEDVTQYGKEVWFHREMSLPFLPVEDMPFEFGLAGDADGDSRFHSYAPFRVQEVRWREADNKVRVWLLQDPHWDFVLPREIDQAKWTPGMAGDRAWLKK